MENDIGNHLGSFFFFFFQTKSFPTSQFLVLCGDAYECLCFCGLLSVTYRCMVFAHAFSALRRDGHFSFLVFSGYFVLHFHLLTMATTAAAMLLKKQLQGKPKTLLYTLRFCSIMSVLPCDFTMKMWRLVCFVDIFVLVHVRANFAWWRTEYQKVVCSWRRFQSVIIERHNYVTDEFTWKHLCFRCLFI